MNTVRILLVDDHVIFRDGMKALLNDHAGYRVVAEVGNGKEALKIIDTLQVDLVLTDVHMPEMDGFELAKQLRLNRPDLRIVVLTMDSNQAYIDSFKNLGANGYITKATNSEDLRRVLHHVFEPDAGYQLAITEQEILNAQMAEHGSYAKLTQREREILAHIARGLTDKEIAGRLFLSPYTVITHRKNLLSKLGLSNKVELTRYALEHQIIVPEG